jgi:hypothetical protein
MPERTIGQIMQGHADDAVNYARLRFRSPLDFTVPSLEHVDRMLGAMYFDVPRTLWQKIRARLTGHQRSDEELWTLSKMWGGYVGEVIRRQWGGSWHSSLQPDASVRISLEVAGSRCYPCDEVKRRLSGGRSDKTPGIYKVMESQLGLAPISHSGATRTSTPGADRPAVR